MTPAAQWNVVPSDPIAFRHSIDDTLRRVAAGDDHDAFMRAAWFLLSMEPSRRSGLDEPRPFFRYYLENYVCGIIGRNCLDVEEIAERALDGANVDELADYVRDHELRRTAALAIRRARGELI